MRACCNEVHPCKAHVSAAPSPLYREITGNIKNFVANEIKARMNGTFSSADSNLGLAGWLDRASKDSSGISAKLAFKQWYSDDLGRPGLLKALFFQC
eukprot:663866-Pelagomonas_calceolata.AAC.2